MFHFGGDILGERTGVERVRPMIGKQFQGAGQIRLDQEIPSMPGKRTISDPNSGV